MNQREFVLGDGETQPGHPYALNLEDQNDTH